MLNGQMTVAEIVLDHSEAAAVFTRYRIDYCCKGDLALDEACRQRGADAKKVLVELEEAIAQRQGQRGLDLREVDTETLVDHIVRRHHRYLRDAMPFLVPLAKKVARVHGGHNPKLLDVRDAVEELSDVLLPHLEREEQVLFPALSKHDGRNPEAAEVVTSELSNMHADHLEVSKLLERIRGGADEFTLPDWACTSYATLFRELEAVETDVFEHVHLENHVLMPRFLSKAA